jgi:hypothetical protein
VALGSLALSGQAVTVTPAAASVSVGLGSLALSGRDVRIVQAVGFSVYLDTLEDWSFETAIDSWLEEVEIRTAGNSWISWLEARLSMRLGAWTADARIGRALQVRLGSEPICTGIVRAIFEGSEAAEVLVAGRLAFLEGEQYRGGVWLASRAGAILGDIMERARLPGPTAGEAYADRAVVGSDEAGTGARFLSLDVGESVWPIVGDTWDVGDSLYRVITDLVSSEDGWLFESAAGTITFWERNHEEADFEAEALADAARYYVIEDQRAAVAAVRVLARVREVFSDQVIWTAEEDINLRPGVKYRVRASYEGQVCGLLSAPECSSTALYTTSGDLALEVLRMTAEGSAVWLWHGGSETRILRAGATLTADVVVSRGVLEAARESQYERVRGGMTMLRTAAFARPGTLGDFAQHLYGSLNRSWWRVSLRDAGAADLHLYGLGAVVDLSGRELVIRDVEHDWRRGRIETRWRGTERSARYGRVGNATAGTSKVGF